MKLSKYIMVLILLLIKDNLGYAAPIITFFVRHYPEQLKEPSTNAHLTSMIATPGKMSSKILKNNYLSAGTFDGLFATYWGYLTVSNFDGQITFPRKQQATKFKLLITERINPIMMIANTVHHWELDKTIPAELYSIERKQDKDTKLYFWDVKKVSLPANNNITIDTIILFAKPNNIFIPTGITITNDNPQLILPDIYAKKEFNLVGRAFWVLRMRHFFSPVTKIYKKDSDTYYSEHLNV